MTELFHRRRNLIIYLCPAGAIAAVYWPVRHFEFTICDDDVYVTQNPDMQGGFKSQGRLIATSVLG